MTVRDTISARERKGLKNSGLDRCFVCGKKFDDDYFPNLALIKGAKNNLFVMTAPKQYKKRESKYED